MRSITLTLGSLLLAACASSTSNQPSTTTTTSTTTTSTTTSSDTSDPATTTSTDAAPARRRRAVIVPERLETCTPVGAGLAANLTPVPARLDTTLGGCGFGAVSTPDAGFEFDVFSETAVVADRLVCSAGTRPSFDFQSTTYATFSSRHATNEDWVVAFAVDDGERVHVAIEPRRICQGTAPTRRLDARGLEIPGANRAVTLYRCAPHFAPCPPVP